MKERYTYLVVMHFYSIGIGETLRRIVGKAISWQIKNEVTDAAGPLQVAAGLKSGAEAACHTMRQMFEEEGTAAIILVDATNYL